MGKLPHSKALRVFYSPRFAAWTLIPNPAKRSALTLWWSILQLANFSPGISAISLTGRFTLGNRLTDVEHGIRERIGQGLRKLVLDLSALESIDSAGIGVLAVCCGCMEREGGKVAVVGAGGRVKELLELTHFDRVAAMYPDVASAHSTLSET
jgi:anti-anti-sigma factor